MLIPTTASTGAAAPTVGGGLGYSEPGPAVHHGLLHYLFHNPVTSTLGQTAQDFVNMAEGSAGAVVHGAYYAGTHSPLQTLHQIGPISDAMVSQMQQDFAHPLRHPGYTIADFLTLAPIPGSIAGRALTIARAGELSSRVAEVTKPFMEAGDVGGALKAAQKIGRGDEFARVIQTAEGAPGYGQPKPYGRQLRESVLYGAPKEERLLKDPSSGDLIPGWTFSKDPTIKAVQKLVDKNYDRFPEGRPPPIWRLAPAFWRDQGGRIRSATSKQAVQAGQVGTAAGQTLWKKFGNVPDMWHLAVRMVKEGTSPAVFRDYHEGILSGRNKDVTLNPRNIKETKARLQLLDQVEASNLLRVEHTAIPSAETGQTYHFDLPKLTDEAAAAEAPGIKGTLGEYLDSISKVGSDREQAFRHLGTLGEENLVRRAVAPLHDMLHGTPPVFISQLDKLKNVLAGKKGRYPDDPSKWQPLENQIKQLQENPTMPYDVAKQLVDEHGLARIHYDLPLTEKLTNFATTGYRRAFKGLSKPAPPGTITHPFKAEVLRHGGGDINTARVMALTYSEAQRYLSFYHGWERLAASLRPYATGIPEKNRRLVKLPPSMYNGPDIPRSQAERQLARRAEQGGEMKPEEAGALGLTLEAARRSIIPDLSNIWDTATKKFRSVDTEEKAPQGYGWADNRLLGGLDKANPLLSILADYPIAKHAVNFLDAVNTANKTALLYLKPSYAFPNAMSNAAMNLIQQGFMAPPNLSRSIIMWKQLPREVRQGMLASVGEGGSEALGQVSGTAFGLLQRGSRALSRLYGMGVDQPFRISAFTYEARLAGFATKEELKALVTSEKPEMRAQLEAIGRRAQDEIINYELLSPAEQAVMRRLIFFYPWIKGSTRYVGNLYKEHPVAFGLQGQIGRMEQGYNENILGNVPVWARGLVPLGPARGGIVSVANPSAFSIAETPATLLQEGLNLVSGTPNPDLAGSSELGPAERFGLDMLTAGVAGQKSAAAGAGKTAPFETALKDMFSADPLYQLYRRVRNQQSPRAIYQNQSLPADLDWFLGLGGLQSRPFNRAMANYVQYLRENPHP
jgi:hypothetical protein